MQAKKAKTRTYNERKHNKILEKTRKETQSYDKTRNENNKQKPRKSTKIQ